MKASPEPALSLRGLAKSYGKLSALRGIDLEVGRGEIFGFLGPNGAGKTTAIRCLLDLIRPDGGEVRVFGLDPRREPVAIRKRTGYLPGELVLDDNFTAREVFRLFDRMRGGGTDWNRVDAMASRLRLDPDKAIRNFSKGNKQKVGVIQALTHDPELLLLDEPTSGLDPLMQREVLALAREARERGTTVFFSSHVLSEVEEISDRVAIVRAGEIVETGGTAALAGRAFIRVRLTLASPIGSAELDALAGIRVLENRDGLELLVRVDGDMDDLLKALAGHRVRAMETERPSLEEIFLGYYEESGEGITGMSATFRYLLRRFRLAIVGWGLALAVIAAITVRLYATILERMAVVEELMAGMPPLLVALAGEAKVLATPGGWLHVKFFVMVPILLGIYGVMAGAGLFANDEERGRLDLLMAYPISRARMFAGRLLALVLATVMILAICWASVFLALPGSGMQLGFGESLLPFANTLAPLWLFEMLALALAMVLPSKLLAAGVAGLVLVASFFIEILSAVEPALLPLARSLPLHYYRGGLSLYGFGWPGFLGQLAAAVSLGGFAFWRFQRRDIRVMGEGTWKW